MAAPPDGAGAIALCRQPFYPDASRLFEEIDRLWVDDKRTGQAAVQPERRMTSYRAVPSGGYTKGPAGGGGVRI